MVFTKYTKDINVKAKAKHRLTHTEDIKASCARKRSSLQPTHQQTYTGMDYLSSLLQKKKQFNKVLQCSTKFGIGRFCCQLDMYGCSHIQLKPKRHFPTNVPTTNTR